jgi:hypothetical protein
MTPAEMKVPLEMYLIFKLSEREAEHFDVEFPEFYRWCSFCCEPLIGDALEKCPKSGE